MILKKSDKRRAYLFAKYEHKFEKFTNILIAILLILIYFIEVNIIIKIVIILLAIIHTIARICHEFEKKYFNRR